MRAPASRVGRPEAGLLGVALVVGVLLRVWGIGSTRLSFDETFTATVARLPVGAMWAYLRHADAHPPLDYLVRAPLARAGVSEGWLRMPSVVASVGTLAVGAWWWRPLGRLGMIAVALLAGSSFAVTYAHDARMYAGLGLAGISVAAAAARWLDRRSPTAVAVMGAGLLAALALQGGALLVVPGVIAIAGLRRDRAAWLWRGAVCAAVVAWAVAWGPAFLDQSRRTGHSWVQLTSPHYALVVVNELVDSTPAVALLVLVLVIAGAVVIPRGPLRTVTISLGWGVIATYVVVGTHFHVLLPRALAFSAWAPLVALAALAEAGLRRSTAIGAGVLALVAVVMVPSAAAAAKPAVAPHAAALAMVRRQARPGDEVVMAPAFLWTMPAWYFGVRWWSHGSFADRPDLQAQGTVVGGVRPTGRVWLVVSVAYAAHTGGLSSCAPPQRLDQFVVYCLEDPADGR